jgi:hypothetical protein
MLITVVFKKLQLAKWWFFLWLFMFIIILIFYNHFLPIAKSSLISVTFIAILLQEIGCMFFLCIITTGFSGCSFIANRIHSYFYPISFIINEYFNILFLLRKQKPTFINTAYRQNLLNKMESVAYCIQNNLCNRLKSNDIALDKWFENITCEIASSLRQKKQLILFPNPNSKDLLCKYFENALVDIVTANWDNLEKVKPENYSVRQLLTDRIKNLFHILIIGAIPVICLSVIQNTKLALHNPFLDYVILACMLWFISTLLINIDPLFVVKVGIFKELKHILSFSRKK